VKRPFYGRACSRTSNVTAAASAPPLETTWTQHCATLKPTRSFTHLILNARGLGDEAGDSLVFVDALQIAPACL
jgi:hypothetical protein